MPGVRTHEELGRIEYRLTYMRRVDLEDDPVLGPRRSLSWRNTSREDYLRASINAFRDGHD
ncbi:hypothetical protein G3T36_18330 [Diaminobutyricibacter tongyongensis]|uniref:Uncharacterized protein n=1 Tax=Leifsonia tongyongensis TaxID=1268043 RepID=A0A6L9Y321_9MICO|nr:hypothetical protein [Diaminobutyricibacter tongyongensis]NEN07817.1 hypothetical protein [Diaminobutyricibacter tongyongensis]